MNDSIFAFPLELRAQAEQVMLDYHHDLAVAAVRADDPFILCMVGLVGSGKSTCLCALIPHLRVPPVRISTDEIRRRFRKLGVERPEPSDTDAVLLTLADRFGREGCSLALDANCGRLSVEIGELAAAISMPLRWIKVDPQRISTGK